MKLSGPDTGCRYHYLRLIFSNGISKFNIPISAQTSEKQKPGLKSQSRSGAPRTHSPTRAQKEFVETVGCGEWPDLGGRAGPTQGRVNEGLVVDTPGVNKT